VDTDNPSARADTRSSGTSSARKQAAPPVADVRELLKNKKLLLALAIGGGVFLLLVVVLIAWALLRSNSSPAPKGRTENDRPAFIHLRPGDSTDPPDRAPRT
jgi:hypothetical protein